MSKAPVRIIIAQFDPPVEMQRPVNGTFVPAPVGTYITVTVKGVVVEERMDTRYMPDEKIQAGMEYYVKKYANFSYGG